MFSLSMAMRYLAGRKLRSVLTTLAILFGVLVIFSMNSLLPAFIQAFQANAMALAEEVDVTVSSQTGEAFAQDAVQTVAAVEGVRAVSGSLERAIGLQPNYFDRDPAVADRVTAVNLVGIDPDAARTVGAYNILEGRFLQPDDRNTAVITQSLAEIAGVGLGETLSLPTASGRADLTVVGILPQKVLPGNERVLVTLPEAQTLMGMAGQINVIEANFTLTDEAGRAQIEQAIQSALGPSFSLGVLASGAELLGNIQIAQMIFNLLGVMALLMGGFIIFNTFRTIVAERRHDIGMLRSLGASRRTITGLILAEGLIQGVVGTASGLLLGYLLAQAMLKGVQGMMSNFMAIDVSRVAFQPGVLIAAIVAGLGITLLAGLLPARAASRITPLEALRPVAPEVQRKRLAGVTFWIGAVMVALAIVFLVTGNAALIGLGSLLFIVGLILTAPALIDPVARLFGALIGLLFARDGATRLGEGNLTRQPGRAAITASTTLISLTILIMAASLISSAVLTFRDMLRKSLSSDYLLIPPSVSLWGMDVGAKPDLAEGLRDIEGVQVVSSVRYAATQINDQVVGLLGIDPEAYVQTGGLTFIEGDEQAAFREMQSGRAMIINGVLATKAGIQLGDTVSLMTATGEVTYRVVGLATDYLNAKTMTGYLSQANVATDFGRSEDVFFQINLKPGADEAAVETAMNQALLEYPQFQMISGKAYLEQNENLLNSMFAGMIALVIFLAIPSLIAMINTLAIGVLERRREIGMLRAVGATRKQVNRMILAEALILSLIGTALGVASGLYLGYTSAQAFGAAGFPITYVFPGLGVALAVVSGVVIGVVAAIIPARHAARLQIVNALQYE